MGGPSLVRPAAKAGHTARILYERNVDALEAFISRLPKRSELIRLKFWRDPVFRTVCEDYRDMLEAMAKLEQAQPPDLRIAAEYRQLADELLAEAVGMLAREQEKDEGEP